MDLGGGRSWCAGGVTIVTGCGGEVSAVVAVCVGALTVVGALHGGGDSFGVKVGLRWGSVLGSLLFI